MKILKKLILLLLIVFIIISTLPIGYYFAVTKDVALSPEKLLLSENNLLIYDEEELLIDNVSSFTMKHKTDIRDIPKHTQLAFINVEDKRFYTHHGFDVRRIIKALLNNVKARSFKEGASTISQQLIKNTHLTQEKTMKRKLQEWKLTRALEKRYSKDEILEKYLNSIYFGHNCFGIYNAAEFYFGKTPSELDLADSAILAGLVKSPNYYSPFKNAENCALRKESVLNAMLRNASITPEEKQYAMEKPLPLPQRYPKRNLGYLTFVFDELSSLIERYNLPTNGKIEIFTGLDAHLQKKLEDLTQDLCDCDKTILCLNPKTGNYKACISSVGNIRRLPGSLIKPLLVYAPALEENIISPATPILDERINYNGYSPDNYDGKFNGYQSIRECVAKSLNVPAVKVLQTVGVKKATEYLTKLNLQIESEDQSLALALGGMKHGFTLRDIMAAYTTFLNEGVYQNCSFISQIKINDRLIYSRPKIKTRVFSQESAYLMTDLLRSCVKFGTAKKLRTLDFDIAAKTGTVGTKKGNTDAYALSYTTRDLVGIWLGNVDNIPISHTGGGEPCNYLLQINQALSEHYQLNNELIEPFFTPKTICRAKLDKSIYNVTHNILLADPQSPAEYTFEEIFKTENLPTKTSDFFSVPRILLPNIELEDNQVKISLCATTPNVYAYKIDRYDYTTHTTIYDGPFTSVIFDKSLEDNKNYLYTIIPYYKGNSGVALSLPAINTKKSLTREEQDIINQDWWRY